MVVLVGEFFGHRQSSWDWERMVILRGSLKAVIDGVKQKIFGVE